MILKDEITNFPKAGGSKKVSLRNSNYQVFPSEYAKNLKENHPDIWRLGGNIEGNNQFRRLYPIAENGGKVETPTQEMAVRKREAWAARHSKNFRIAGTVAQLKWLVVGSRGLSYMKNLIQNEIQKRKNGSIMIKKNLLCERVKTEKEKSFTFVASADNVDRMGDVIDQKNWSLEAYRRNPIILFNHDSRSLPIGKGAAEVVDGQLMIDIEFDESDNMAKRIKSKVDGGFLNAVSVGFNPIEAYQRNTLPKESKYYGESGMYFKSAELLEVSIVTIPANSQATASKSYDENVLDLFAQMVSKHILNVIEEDGKFVITYAAAEKEDVEQDEEQDEDQPVELVEQAEEQGYEYEDDEDEKDKDKDFNQELIRALLA